MSLSKSNAELLKTCFEKFGFTVEIEAHDELPVDDTHVLGVEGNVASIGYLGLVRMFTMIPKDCYIVFTRKEDMVRFEIS